MVTLRIRYGLDLMPDDTKDKVIAPKISRLAAPTAPDISAERKPLLNAFIFNFKLSLALSNKNRQFLFNVIRKAEDAFDEYCRAVDSLREYGAARGLKLSHYFSAMRHFEHCVARVYQAVSRWNALVETWGGEKQFDRGDGSILERIHIIHAEIKHMDEGSKRASECRCECTRTDGHKPSSSSLECSVIQNQRREDMPERRRGDRGA
jgi:hypothetical protein